MMWGKFYDNFLGMEYIVKALPHGTEEEETSTGAN